MTVPVDAVVYCNNEKCEEILDMLGSWENPLRYDGIIHGQMSDLDFALILLMFEQEY